MHYPWWYVPHATAPMLIAAVAIVHVLVSHYAVGGGLFLAVETGYAYQTRNRRYLDYLRVHTQFFVLITVVLGAITGVGIWWTIGLASPLATETLIRTFVFGWAIEWVFFVLELVSAFIFYYYWGKLPEKTHVRIGWIYGLSAWISLVLISGITAFMLNPGVWLGHPGFWIGLFNPQMVPQTVARTGGALLLSSLYVYLHAAFALKDEALRHLIARRSARPALLGVILVGLGGVGWLVFLPDSARMVLVSAAVLNVFMALVVGLSVVLCALLFFGPYRNPDWVSPGFAVALFLFGLAAFSMAEFLREAVRKPYVIYNVVLGNQVFAHEVAGLRRTGYLEGGRWTRAWVKHEHPEVFVGRRIDESRLVSLPLEKQVGLGQVLFQYHCNDCHAVTEGYSAVSPLLRGKTPRMIRSLVEDLHRVQFAMPPWSGTPEEAELLTAYLTSIAPPRPKNMLPDLDKQEAAP